MLKFVSASLVIVSIAFGQTALTTAQIAKRVSPSVVVIQGKTDSGDVQGSGFIISKEGKIVTNLHVIRDMKTASVQLANGEIFDTLSVLATDERRDLALVQIAGFNLPVLELGDSDLLIVGETLVIVGSPHGLEGTVTAGILSSVRDSGDGFKVLQTDAAVNPGNSGGPLLNNRGQAIGVVSFKLKSSEGLNLSIPINYVRGLLNIIHAPISLGQMRNTLSVPDEPTTGLSLKDTLNWLNTTIPTSPIEYTFDQLEHNNHKIEAVKYQSKTWTLDSCTVTVGAQSVSTPQNCLTSKDPGCTVSTLTARFTIPLQLVSKVSVDRRAISTFSPGMKVIAGDQWFYDAVLATSSKAIRNQVTLSEFPESGVPFDSDDAVLSFGEDAVAQRVADHFRHAADLCRESGSPKPTPELHSDGPSLKETLDWLKEKIPLGTVNFVRTVVSNGVSTAIPVNTQSVVFSLDSCTGVVGQIVKLRMSYDSSGVETSRYTVPIGSLVRFPVERADNIQASQFISGDKYSYRLWLVSGSKVIQVSKSQEFFATLLPHNPPITENSVTENVYLTFGDESIANRVADAFKHAADLCRKKEPF